MTQSNKNFGFIDVGEYNLDKDYIKPLDGFGFVKAQNEVDLGEENQNLVQEKFEAQEEAEDSQMLIQNTAEKLGMPFDYAKSLDIISQSLGEITGGSFSSVLNATIGEVRSMQADVNNLPQIDLTQNISQALEDAAFNLQTLLNTLNNYEASKAETVQQIQSQLE